MSYLILIVNLLYLSVTWQSYSARYNYVADKQFGDKMKKIKLNEKQKKVLIVSLSFIVISFIIWIAYGGEVFTKTEVLIEVNDELFGTIKEWKDQFVWGLDLTMSISGIITAITFPTLFFLRTKKS